MGSDPIQLIAIGMAALSGAFAFVLLTRRRPEWSMALWTATLFLTPVWLGASVGVYVSALTAMTVLAIVSGFGRGLTWTFIDTLMVVLFLTLVLAYVFANSVTGHIQDSLLVWFIPYVWGRIVLSRVSAGWVAACIAVGAIVASVLAIFEFATGENIFLAVPGAATSVWGTLQIRGGLFRSEGAFGHSIALGGTLAMSAAFILAVPWRPWLRAGALVIVGIATVLTFSRLGIIGFMLTLVLGIFLLGAYLRNAFRIVMLSILSLGATLAIPVLLQVFGEAGAEAEGSAGYRVDLLQLVNSMVPLGVSPAREVLATGQDYWGGFRSIDSALILIGLRFGLICLTIVLLLIVMLVISIVRGKATPASVALVAQIPAFATVALITQYAVFVWFVAGLAVASYTLIGEKVPGGGLDSRVKATEDAVGVT